MTTVGNIRRVKGHDLLIMATKMIVHQFPKVYFSIVGDALAPAYFAELQTLVRDLELVNHVRFDGGATNLRQHLAVADTAESSVARFPKRCRDESRQCPLHAFADTSLPNSS